MMIQVLAMVSVLIGASSLLINTVVLYKLTTYDAKKPSNQNNNQPTAPLDNNDPELIKAKQKAQAEQEAFEELLGYSIDTAYGMKREE